VEFQWNGGGADGLGKADDFFDRLALHVQRNQQRRNLRVRALAGEDFGHHRMRLFAGERLTMVGDAMEGVEDHSIKATGGERYLQTGALKKPRGWKTGLKRAAEKGKSQLPAPKGAIDFEGLAVSLKRYPDTKPEFSRSL